MSKTIKKIMTTEEVVNIVDRAKQLEANAEKIKEFPINIRWALKKNVGAFEKTYREYDGFKNELIKEIQDEFFTDEKSVINSEGTERTIKDEYLLEFNQKIVEVNKRLDEIAKEENEYTISLASIDDFVENFPNDTTICFEDIEFLLFMNE